MIPKRISAKIFTTEPEEAVDHDAFIALFHEFIREKTVEGLLLDVADYAHVPEGPGVMLIGHDVDYGIDQTAGRAGLLAVKKRIEGGELAALLDETVRLGLLAAKAVEGNGSAGVQFAPGAVQVQFIDRLAHENSDAGFGSVKGELEALAKRLFGEGAQVERADADEPRRPLAATLSGAGGGAIDDLVARLSS
ncbi:MAG: hypothetical protein QF570_06235 [Myxococcota bacterium]|nr:hypothetical protein [Myxococcota bacterium]